MESLDEDQEVLKKSKLKDFEHHRWIIKRDGGRLVRMSRRLENAEHNYLQEQLWRLRGWQNMQLRFLHPAKMRGMKRDQYPILRMM